MRIYRPLPFALLAFLLLAAACGGKEPVRTPEDARPEPEYTARVTFLGDMRYSVEIVAPDGSAVQTLRIRHGVDPAREGHIQFLDLNRDGHADLRMFAGHVDGKPWFKVWVFDPERGEFVWPRTRDLSP